jgi:hypothetical protein
MLYQIDYQVRVPYPGNEDGYYYWTNAWIVDVANNVAALAAAGKIDLCHDSCMTHAVQQVRMQLKQPPGMGNVYSTVSLGNEPCDFPEGTSGYTLLSYIRVNLYAGGRQVGYKRWRMPTRLEDIEGPYIASFPQAAIQSAFNELIEENVLAGRDGSLITSAEVDPLLRPWQLRHGTERRNRVVIAP